MSTAEQIEVVHRALMGDRRVSVRHLAEKLGISFGSVQAILIENLMMKKISTRWIPRMLT